MAFKEDLLLIAARLVGLPRQVAWQAGSGTPWNSDTDEDDDSEHYPYPHGYPAREINQDVMDAHRDSVTLISTFRNITLVSSVVQVGFWRNNPSFALSGLAHVPTLPTAYAVGCNLPPPCGLVRGAAARL